MVEDCLQRALLGAAGEGDFGVWKVNERKLLIQTLIFGNLEVAGHWKGGGGGEEEGCKEECMN